MKMTGSVGMRSGTVFRCQGTRGIFQSGLSHNLRATRRPFRTGSAFDSLDGHISSSNGAHKPATGESKQERTTFIRQASQTSNDAGPADKKASKPFSNRNKYWVPLDLVDAFEKEWRHREFYMQQCEGFESLKVTRDGEDYVITSNWETIPQWEKWSLSPEARKSHLPPGIYQYVPPKGEGFPDDFTPFKDLSQAVNAKY